MMACSSSSSSSLSLYLFPGLKPGQRKVLYTCMKRNDKREVKVAQLAGSVAEMSAYHHGEVWPPSDLLELPSSHAHEPNLNNTMREIKV